MFGSPSDPMIGVVGLLIKAYTADEFNGDSNGSNPCESKIKVFRCLISAMIPCTILTTALNALSGAGTKMDKTWALGVINDLARLGVDYGTPSGLVLMAADFTICMAFPMPYIGPIEPVIISVDGQAYHSLNPLNLGVNDVDSLPLISYYQNQVDLKFYKDPNYQNLLEDGFYVLSYNSAGVNGSYIYIFDGKYVGSGRLAN